MSGVIINGTYYPDGDKPQTVGMNSQYKIWNIDEQRRVHAVDILQPHVNGKPSGAYIRQYPEEASKMFTADQINEWGNHYGTT